MLDAERRILVWGCGQWLNRRFIVPDDEPMESVTEDMPEFDMLPDRFVREWGQELGSEHWAEIITTTKRPHFLYRNLLENSVQGYKEVGYREL